MPSSADIARIKADLTMLEKARDECVDSGLCKVIDAWIEDAKKTLVAEEKKYKQMTSIKQFKTKFDQQA
jgi:hypothetical protein